MTRRRAAFTLLELAIVLSISAVLLPAVYLFARSQERTLLESAAQVESADAARTISEELRRDLVTMHWADAASTALRGSGPCAEVRYEVTDAVLFRRAPAECGGDRALARHVEGIARTPWGGVEMTFARHTRAAEPFRLRFLFAGGVER